MRFALLMHRITYETIHSLIDFYDIINTKTEHRITYHIPGIEYKKCINSRYLTAVIPENIQSYIPDILTQKPDPSAYDVLLLSINVLMENRNKFHNAYIKELINNFTRKNKKVLIIKTDMSVDYPNINIIDNVWYGYPGNHEIYSCSELSKNITNKKFRHCGILTDLRASKTTALTRSDFYKIYNLDIKKKIIGIFLCKARKFNKIKNKHVFLSALEQLTKIGNTLGYQFVQKVHRWDVFGIHGKCISLKKIPIIDPSHTKELVTFISCAVTCASNIAFELSVYNIPCLELCYSSMYPINIDDIRDYIYGICIDNNYTEKQLISIFEHFLDSIKLMVNTINLDSHPFYGDIREYNPHKLIESLVDTVKSLSYI